MKHNIMDQRVSSHNNEQVSLVADSGSAITALRQAPVPVAPSAFLTPLFSPGSTLAETLPTEQNECHDPPTVMSALRAHGPVWALRAARQLLRARIQLHSCDSLGKWVRVCGRVRVHNEGAIFVGDRVRFLAETAKSELVTWGKGEIKIGEGTTINYATSISAAGRVVIGEDCLIGTYVNIMDCTFHNMKDRSWSLEATPITIEDRVWLGNRSVIMPGVTIGHDAIVAACSLVTRDVPPNTMVVGVPARVVKQLN